jgi:hypothetical protein
MPQQLTEITINSLKIPIKGDKTYWERPLGVRVSSTGVKTYIVMLKRGQRKAIARVGTIPLKQARTEALRLKAAYQPSRYADAPVSLSDARTLYLEQIHVRPATRRYYVTHLAARPDIPLQEIDHRHILHILDKLTPGSAITALRAYSAFFRWCVPRYIKFQVFPYSAPLTIPGSMQ